MGREKDIGGGDVSVCLFHVRWKTKVKQISPFVATALTYISYLNYLP